MHAFTLRLLPLLGLACGTALHATDYYLSADGNDDHPGTFLEPLRTLDAINALDLEPGDTVFFRSGDTFAGTLLLDADDSGDATNPVTLTAYGEGRAILDGGTAEGARITSAHHLKFRKLHFIGDGRKTGNTRRGLDFSDGSHLYVADCEFEGFQKAGLRFWNCDDITVLRVSAHDNGFAGIHVHNPNWDTDQGWNENCHISHSVAYNNPGDPTRRDNHSGSGILVSQMHHAVIEYCEAYENGWDMPRTGNGPVGIWFWNVNNSVIQYCIAHHNRSPGRDGGGFDLDGGGAQLRYPVLSLL